MALVTLVQGLPRLPATGEQVAVKLAGGGSRAYDQLGIGSWRSGVANRPRFTAAIGFNQAGPTGGALPQVGKIRFISADQSLNSTIANYHWIGARVEISTGDDRAQPPAYTSRLIGVVASASSADGELSLTVADLSRDFDKPALPDTFAGTGGLEGGDDATGRTKRRSWGYVFNIEGLLLDKANNIYEFGDPSRPLSSFVMVKDKGAAGSMVTLPWQGSAAATLAALRTSAAPEGGCVAAPSIACVKWWTVPVGPLTADLTGEGAPYVDRPASIAAQILTTYSATVLYSGFQ